MRSITKTYLTEIVSRLVNKTIDMHRRSKRNLLYYERDENIFITDEEILEFICTIPYFDEGLKDFLLGNIEQQNIIISQSWEIQFIKHCTSWAESFEWLHGNDYFLSDAHISSIKKNVSFLSLPY